MFLRIRVEGVPIPLFLSCLGDDARVEEVLKQMSTDIAGPSIDVRIEDDSLARPMIEEHCHLPLAIPDTTLKLWIPEQVSVEDPSITAVTEMVAHSYR